MTIMNTNVGFIWGICKVERICSNYKPPKFQVLRVSCPNGEIIEILMRPRSTIITKRKHSKLKKDK